VLAIVAALGMVAVLAIPAVATHVEPEFVDGNPTCAGEGFGNELSIGVGDLTAGGTKTFSSSAGTIDITASADLKTISFSNAVPPLEAIVIKAGSGGNLYVYDPPVSADTGLVTPLNDGGQQATVSHISVCFGTATPPSEAPPSEAPPSEVAESELPAESEVPVESEREGELGGNPTPAPVVPDTAMGDFGQLPATVLSLVLIAALAGMVYVRLARQR
jgi:hypothetical protein